MSPTIPGVRVIETPRQDSYQDKVIHTYNDSAVLWQKCLGDNLSFQFGLFDKTELAQGPKPGPIGASEFRHFERQLELAGLLQPNRPRMARILDLGCGWGHITRHMATLFPECQCIDGINISSSQLRYCADNTPEELISRINLYLCNGQDVDMLPDPTTPYDLVIVRGVYTHFNYPVFEASVARVVKRLATNGTLIVSDTLYHGNLNSYKSAIPDTTDRLACANRKTPDYFTGILNDNGLQIQDIRIMPSNNEVIHWFQVVRLNIEQNFPDGIPDGPIQELHEMSISFTQALAKQKASVYSIISKLEK